jgi:hypothetical protein
MPHFFTHLLFLRVPLFADEGVKKSQYKARKNHFTQSNFQKMDET